MCTRRSAPTLADPRSKSASREPSRAPCREAVDHRSWTRGSVEVLQLDDPLEAGLQVAILFEHPVILVADGLLDSDDLAADFVVEFGGVGISRPVGEHGLRPAVPLRCPDDGHDLDPAAAIPKRLPGFAVRRAPGAECRRCLVARIEVDEDGAPGVQRDRQPEREAGISLPKSRWDNDLATRCGLRVSHDVSEGRKLRYPLGLREQHAETERSGGSAAARSRAEDVA